MVLKTAPIGRRHCQNISGVGQTSVALHFQGNVNFFRVAAYPGSVAFHVGIPSKPIKDARRCRCLSLSHARYIPRRKVICTPVLWGSYTSRIRGLGSKPFPFQMEEGLNQCLPANRRLDHSYAFAPRTDLLHNSSSDSVVDAVDSWARCGCYCSFFFLQT